MASFTLEATLPSWTALDYVPPTSQHPQDAEASMPKSVLTVQQVAEYLSVDPKTVYRMVGRSELPGFKVGGTWRF